MTERTSAEVLAREIASATADLDRALAAVAAEALTYRAQLAKGYRPNAGASRYSTLLGRNVASVEGASVRLAALVEMAPALGMTDDQYRAAITLEV